MAGIDFDLWINLLRFNPSLIILNNCDINSIRHKEKSSLTNNYKKRAHNLIISRSIWEGKITEIYGSDFFLKFKKASIEYELWFRFLDNLNNYNFFESLKIIFKYKISIFLFRFVRYILWKSIKISLPINSHLIEFF